jgi:hypothetical protein
MFFHYTFNEAFGTENDQNAEGALGTVVLLIHQ